MRRSGQIRPGRLRLDTWSTHQSRRDSRIADEKTAIWRAGDPYKCSHGCGDLDVAGPASCLVAMVEVERLAPAVQVVISRLSATACQASCESGGALDRAGVRAAVTRVASVYASAPCTSTVRASLRKSRCKGCPICFSGGESGDGSRWRRMLSAGGAAAHAAYFLAVQLQCPKGRRRRGNAERSVADPVLIACRR